MDNDTSKTELLEFKVSTVESINPNLKSINKYYIIESTFSSSHYISECNFITFHNVTKSLKFCDILHFIIIKNSLNKIIVT